MSAYQQLAAYIKDTDNIQKVLRLLGWDQQVMMPPASGGERSEVMGTLEVLKHRRMTSGEIERLLDAATIEDLDGWDKRNLELIRRQYMLARAVPDALVRAIAETGAHVFNTWSAAKAESDWKAVRDPLKKIFDLTREQAEIHRAILKCDAYDAMLDQFSAGNSQARIDPLFAQLKRDLPPLIQEIVGRQEGGPQPDIFIAESARQPVIDELVAMIGIDMQRARIDTAMHPFSSGTRNDTRFTVGRHDPVADMIMALMHESGHAFYDQNTPELYDGQPIGLSSDYLLYESQALFLEKQVGLHAPFLAHLHETIRRHDPAFAATVEDMRRHYQHVQPGFIRIYADEATYPLHVVLRYEIEKGLFADAVTVDDIPELWNAKMKEYLGVDVPDHARGCMQDMHWFSAYGVGYFPNYTQGALYAAQLAHALKRDIPDFDARVARGDLAAIMQWMTDKVHSWGQYYDAPQLLEKATGEAPDARFFIDHLKSRYLGK